MWLERWTSFPIATSIRRSTSSSTTPEITSRYLANSFSSLAPRFHVDSDLAYLTGRFKTGSIRHDIVIGSTGYRFASYSPVTGPAKTALCTSNAPPGICEANISDPLVDVIPPAGIFSYAKTSPSTGIYESSIIRQQGFSFGDTITLTPRWLVRVAASQDWTWTDSFTDTAATGYQRSPIPGGYVSQGVSPSASVIFKPRADMTFYGTFADSIQAPDVAAANSGSTIIVNASQALPPYRSKEGEIGYKLRLRRINFSTDLFRVERPFANYVVGVVNPVCGTLSGTSGLRGLSDYRQSAQLRSGNHALRQDLRKPDGHGRNIRAESEAHRHRHRRYEQQKILWAFPTTSRIFLPSIICRS